MRILELWSGELYEKYVYSFKVTAASFKFVVSLFCCVGN